MQVSPLSNSSNSLSSIDSQFDVVLNHLRKVGLPEKQVAFLENDSIYNVFKVDGGCCVFIYEQFHLKRSFEFVLNDDSSLPDSVGAVQEDSVKNYSGKSSVEIDPRLIAGCFDEPEDLSDEEARALDDKEFQERLYDWLLSCEIDETWFLRGWDFVQSLPKRLAKECDLDEDEISFLEESDNSLCEKKFGKALEMFTSRLRAERKNKQWLIG